MRVRGLVVVDLPPGDEVELRRRVPDIESRMGRSGSGRRHRVVFGAPDPDDVAAAVRRTSVEELRSGRWRMHVVAPDDVDFATEWRPWLGPVVFDDLVVAPPWTLVPDGPAHVIRIDPGATFGAGGHPSTVNAVHLLRRTLRPGDRVLDLGCGSGILAVIAARLGAGDVLAVDLDPAAGPAVAANARANDVDGIVRFVDRPLEEIDEQVDVVVANIEGTVLERLAPAIVDRVVPAGSIVLAGLLDGSDGPVRDAYARSGWLVVEERSGPDDWRAWLLRGPGTAPARRPLVQQAQLPGGSSHAQQIQQ